MKKTKKYVIVEVELIHEDNVDPRRICEQVEISLDTEEAGVTKAQVIEVWDSR